MIKRKINNEQEEIEIKTKEGSFKMIVGGNTDLFWIVESKEKNHEFIIEKEEMPTYEIFDNLFETIKELDDLYKPCIKENVFTWISEDEEESKANILRIIKQEDQIKLQFEGKSKRCQLGICAICFCMFGSRNNDIAYTFSKLKMDLWNLNDAKILKR